MPSEKSPDQLPAVDERRLAELLGGSVKLKDRIDRETARALTDALGLVKSPESALSNARAWLECARSEGYEEGARHANEAWERKIHKLFGLQGGLNAK